MIDKSKYVVLDVETNGLSSMRDDLLSISLYRPDTEDFYSRFLPLELQKDVYTTYINGIKKRDLKDKTPANAHFERSDVCAVPACSVVAEARVAIILVDELLAKFGGDNLVEMKAHYDS